MADRSELPEGRLDPVREALCDVLNRLGYDSTSEAIRIVEGGPDAPTAEALSDLIFEHVQWCEQHATAGLRAEVARPTALLSAGACDGSAA